MEYTPFQMKPSAEIKITDQQGREVTTVNIIQVLETRSELTIHLPRQIPAGDYHAFLKAYYLVEKESLENGGEQVALEEYLIGSQEIKFSIP